MAWGNNQAPTAPQQTQQNVVIGTKLTPEEFKEQRNKMLADWLASKDALEKAKEKEIQQRNALVAFVTDPTKIAGTENIELGGGYKLRAVKKINYRFVSNKEGVEVVDAVDSVLDRLEKLGPEGKFIAERLVKWKPDLSLSEYKQLDLKFKTIIDEVIETSSGTPTLELVEPKNKE